MTLASESGWRSLSMISQRVGPIPEPWTMLEVMGCGSKNLPSEVLQTWLQPVRKAMIQFRAIGGILRLLIFDNKMEWRTSNAFEKSINKQRIYYLFSNIRVEWIKSTMAQQVLPVGRKAYWSLSNSIGTAGLNHCWTKIFSASLDNIGVTDIALPAVQLPGL